VHRTKGKLSGWASLLQFDAAHAEQAAIELCVSQKFVRKIKGLSFATLNERDDKRWQHGCHQAHPGFAPALVPLAQRPRGSVRPSQAVAGEAPLR
jgi:hypothetical protein